MALPVHLTKDLASKIKAWRADPVLFVRECFGIEPDLWQARVLMLLARGGRLRIALKACAGPGKTAVLAWAGWWFLLCHGDERPEDHPNGLAVSCDRDNLRDGLWKEMARWQGACPLLIMLFEWTKERIFAKDHPSTWFLSARSYSKSADPETMGRTLSGLHGKNIFYLIDESGDMPVSISRSAEQGLTDCVCGLILTAGNTTSTNGLLYFVSTTGRGGWEVVTITGDPDNPERSPRINIDWAREQIKLYGRDNPWVMAYILGEFPPGSLNAILGVDEVEAAMSRHLKPDAYEWSQKRLGVDVARFGDDRTVLFPRQGLAATLPRVMRHVRDSSVAVDIANMVMAAKAKWGSEMEFFDATGGWAAGAVDVLRSNGFSPINVQFASPAMDPRYANRRAEMWLKMAEWIRAGGALPNVPEMVAELTAPTYTFQKGKFLLEDKDQIKKRLGRSPDLADALALTFAFPDMPASIAHLVPGMAKQGNFAQMEYDPFNGMD